MTEFKYVITDELGIHARPAGALVREAKQFTSTIKLTIGERTADVKGIIGLMSLGIRKGDEVTITADGEDAAEAAAALEHFFKENL